MASRNQSGVDVSVRIEGPDLSEVTPWDETAMRGLCEQMVAVVATRVQRDRRMADGRPLDAIPYSTKPTTITYTSETGRRLKPKGGAPAVKNEREVGRRYEGGYAQYKRDSSGAPGVDLTLSGQMLRSFQVNQVTAELGRIGLSGQAAAYGAHVDEGRPWIGVSPEDARLMQDIIDEEVAAAMRRTVPGA